MEIPILGRFLKGNKTSPETSIKPPAQDPTHQTEIEVTPPTGKTNSDAPDVNRDEVRKQLDISRTVLSAGSDFNKGAMERVREDIKDVSPQLLEELVKTLDPSERNFKKNGSKYNF